MRLLVICKELMYLGKHERKEASMNELHEFSERLEKPLMHNVLDPLQKKASKGTNPVNL